MRSRPSARRSLAGAGCLLLVAALAVDAVPRASAAAGRPDIVVINTDDQRFDSLYACLASPPDGRISPTGSQCPMPNVRDDLVAHGVTFAESFVPTSLCCPSRASLFLGRYARHSGVLTNDKPYGGFPAFRTMQGSTVARWLHDAGYRTSLVGKYLNQYDACSSAPTCSVPEGWDDWHAEITDGDLDYTSFQLADSVGEGVAAPTAYSSYSTTMLGQKAVQFVQDSLAHHADQPMFLYLAPFAPHPKAVPAPGEEAAFASMPPWRPPSWNADPSNGPTWSTDTTNNPPLTARQIGHKDDEHRNEMASLLEIDRQVHAVVQALGPAASTTLFVFTSDNGLSWGEHRYFDRKNCEYEECHRVPMVVRYDPLTDPGGAGPGRVDATHPVMNVDVTATIAEAAGLLDVPALDGRSFLSVLDDDAGDDPAWRTAIPGEDYGGLIECTGCIRTPTLRLIRTLHDDPLGAWKYAELCALGADTVTCPTTERDLYDESGDPYELHNLAVATPADGSVQARLAQRLARLTATEAPVVTFTTAPAPFSSSRSATLAFDAVGGSRYWCSLDGSARSPCGSAVDVPGPLAEGWHTFTVVADGDDVPGGVAGTSAAATAAWTVDTSPPDTTITGGARGPTASTTARVSFASSEEPATFRCSLDGAAFAPCVSPVSLAGLSEAAHTFRVRAVDAAGNVDPTPASRTWAVDVTPPDTTIDSGPSGTTSDTTATFAFSASEPAAFQCSLDHVPFTACSSPTTHSNVTAADHTFAVRAIDAAGNVDPSAAAASWTVDPIPQTTIRAGPEDRSATGSSSATFDFESTVPGSTFRCSLEGVSFQACQSGGDGAAFSGLADGAHTFAVFAVNGSYSDPTPAARSWTVDTVPPSVSISSPPADGLLTSASAVVKLASADPAPSSGNPRFVLSERAGPAGTFATVAAGTGHQATRSLASGTWCWEVTAIDPAGNAATSGERCAAVPLDDRALGVEGPSAATDDPGAFRGTITLLTGAGAQATLSFTGHRVGVMLQRSPTGGLARILVDGIVVKTVDTYASSVVERRYLWTSTLPSGPHNLQVGWTGRRSSPSTGTDVAVDGVAVVEPGD
ncbi:MAG: sulfatase-like hydrolase/transferase [Actinomycetota bacterium]